MPEVSRLNWETSVRGCANLCEQAEGRGDSSRLTAELLDAARHRGKGLLVTGEEEKIRRDGQVETEGVTVR